MKQKDQKFTEFENLFWIRQAELAIKEGFIGTTESELFLQQLLTNQRGNQEKSHLQTSKI